MNKQYSPVFCL